ncbi:MAG: LLM class flavin-dependent oxidoreductase [Acidobacteriia bacterium]|nr:LLM class flavin-dependent oxidoreductase [Terriglobia bacterium]
MQRIGSDIEVFSTSPQSIAVSRESYLENVIEVARWSEECGCQGILVYTDNGLVDPWLVAQVILQNTSRLCPLVAVQPAYMHPYSVAKMVSSFGHFYRRRLYLNMVAGGFTNDLVALNDTTPHDKRYARLTEYTTIIKGLLQSPNPVTFRGEFFTVDKLKMTPPLPAELMPGILVSGSSDAGLAAARALGATAVMYPKPAKEYEDEQVRVSPDTGVRVGIIARQNEDEAWAVAHERFPEDRKGQIAHKLAMKVSDSSWHKQLSELADETEKERSPYWLFPFQNYKTFCPYLVGSYDRVALELARYMGIGYRTFILDIPPSREELGHIGAVFAEAQKRVTQGLGRV